MSSFRLVAVLSLAWGAACSEGPRAGGRDAASPDAPDASRLPECEKGADCPQFGRACYETVDCVDRRCTYSLKPYGAVLPASVQTPRDCKRAACDGFGSTTTIADDSDIPDDGDACTLDFCVDGTPHDLHPPQPNGTDCGAGLVCVAGVCGGADAGDAGDSG